MSLIRKISLGKEFPDGAIHYQVGSGVKLNGRYLKVSMILDITKEDDIKTYSVYLNDDGVNVLWKLIYGVPVVVEFNIDFE